MRREARPFAVGGAAALALGVMGAFFDPAQFFRAYLIGFILCASLALGSLAVLMLHHLAGGRWGFVLRRFVEAGARTMPLVAVMFVPVYLGRRWIYSWSRPEVWHADARLVHKHAYLNAPFFLARAAIVFGVWIALAWVLTRWSDRQDREPSPELARAIQRLSAPGLILYAATTLFAAVDWIMSVTPMWFSAIFGMLFMVSHGVTAMAFSILALRAIFGRKEVFLEVRPVVFRDLGNLLFMFLMLWAYMSFSQLIIIWSANLPEEIAWYLPRLQTSWKFVSLALLLFYFAVPFSVLLSRRVKERLPRLAKVAAVVLAMRWLDVVWLIEPSYHPGGLWISWMDLLVPAGLVAVWTAAYCSGLLARPLFALHDARVEERVEHG